MSLAQAVNISGNYMFTINNKSTYELMNMSREHLWNHQRDQTIVKALDCNEETNSIQEEKIVFTEVKVMAIGFWNSRGIFIY